MPSLPASIPKAAHGKTGPGSIIRLSARLARDAEHPALRRLAEPGADFIKDPFAAHESPGQQ